MLRYPIVIYHHASAIAMYPTLLCAYAISPCCMTFHLSAVHRVTSIYPKHIVARYFTPLYCIFFFSLLLLVLSHFILSYSALCIYTLSAIILYYGIAYACVWPTPMYECNRRTCLPAGGDRSRHHSLSALSFFLSLSAALAAPYNSYNSLATSPL